MSGLDSISFLENMISFLEKKYKKDGDWITTKRTKTVFFTMKGEIIKNPVQAILEGFPYQTKELEVDQYEGVADDYWESTAANAIKPLYQLLTLAKMRPDCIWEGD